VTKSGFVQRPRLWKYLFPRGLAAIFHPGLVAFFRIVDRVLAEIPAKVLKWKYIVLNCGLSIVSNCFYRVFGLIIA
jgi:hypothetical protein